eukprot:TRINITY_DN13606_c0_g1_i2.p1 TRINITY_DN13606_c0_g1~~TRINITY_DN13606_c0_g1_i2.p1  ORF type:complete len:372 (-),score=184.15 TRINITY_DN13606_c0_g1_i2:67-1119(-)
MTNDLCVNIDMRRPLRELKQLIAEKIGLTLDEFKIRRALGDRELKDLDSILSFYGIESGTSVYVELGRPLAKTEYIFRVLLEAFPASEAEDAKVEDAEDLFIHIGDVVLDETWDLARVKTELATLEQAPPSDLIRIRERLERRLTKVYLDTQTLKQNALGLKDFKEIVLQRTKVAESITADHLLLPVRQWFPVEYKLGPVEEMAFLKSTTIGELKATFASIYSIPVEDVRVCKPFAYQLKDLDNMPKLDWFGVKTTDASTLGGAPWRTRSGDYILFKDNRQPERVIEEAVPVGAVGWQPPVERALKIYSLEEQMIREAERLSLEEEQKKNEEAARQEAIIRVEEAKKNNA